MSDLIPFEFRSTNVRVVTIDGKPWFVAADVCYILGYSNSRDAVAKHVRDHQKGTSRIATPSGDQVFTIINEFGLYRLMMRARTVLADEFQDWVTDEVLPAIRKTGRYEVAPRLPQSYAEALRELAATVEERDAAKAKVIELHPKADAWDTLADTGADYAAREAAYILNRDPAISTGQNRLLQLLRDWRLIDRFDKPYANHAAHVTLRPQTRVASDGERVQAKPQVRITVQGLSYLHKRLGGVAPLDFGEEAS